MKKTRKILSIVLSVFMTAIVSLGAASCEWLSKPVEMPDLPPVDMPDFPSIDIPNIPWLDGATLTPAT